MGDLRELALDAERSDIGAVVTERAADHRRCVVVGQDPLFLERAKARWIARTS
jgi:hypothetical protein